MRFVAASESTGSDRYAIATAQFRAAVFGFLFQLHFAFLREVR